MRTENPDQLRREWMYDVHSTGLEVEEYGWIEDVHQADLS